MPEESHVCSIGTPKPKTYRVYCTTCGKVGREQDLLVDAKAIAERHEEVGGFG